MEVAIKPVMVFLLLYFSYYYVLRFIQSVFQETIGCINRKLGKFLYIMSTPAHELAHLLVAILCLAQIEEVKFFPKGDKPGFVSYKIGSRILFFTSIKKFFIGIAPALLNIPLFIFLETKYILKCETSEISRILDPTMLFTKEGWITLLLFLVLISGIAPSHQDFKGMFQGLILFSFVIFGVSFITGTITNIKSIDVSGILVVIVYYLIIIIISLLLNLIINYRSGLRITLSILVNSLNHSFKKN